MKRKVFADFKYLNRGPEHPISLISVGMIDDRGNELYAINVDAPLSAIWQNRWTRENLWPTLPLEPVNKGAIAVLDWDSTHPDIANVRKLENLREDVYQFLVSEGEPEVWGSYSAFDYVLLSQLWGTFEDHRPWLPMFIKDIQQLGQELESETWLAVQLQAATSSHNALQDARDIRNLHTAIIIAGDRCGCKYDCSLCHQHCEDIQIRCGAGCTVPPGLVNFPAPKID